MPHYIALLRGINLGRRRLTMDRLRAVFAELGLADVATFIASGNVIFTAREGNAPRLTAKIERHLARSLGYPVDTFLRTREEIAAVAAHQPFPAAALAKPVHAVYAGFLREPLSAAQARGLRACRTAIHEFSVSGRQYYWLCRKKTAESWDVWGSPGLKALQLPSSSMRNLTTVRKLAELYPPV